MVGNYKDTVKYGILEQHFNDPAPPGRRVVLYGRSIAITALDNAKPSGVRAMRSPLRCR
jgi:hypothetical protein